MLMVGWLSSLRIVPRPVPSAIVAFVGGAEVDGERLVRLELGVAVDQDGDRLTCRTRSKGHAAGTALVVTVRQRGRAVRRREVDGDRLALALDRLTVKTKAVVPLLPSSRLTSLMLMVGWSSSLRIVPRPVPSAIVAFAAR